MGLSNHEPQSTDNQVTAGQTELTLGQRASEIIRGAQIDGAGNIILPEDTPTELREFVQTEKMRRDTQSAYTKGQQENATLKAQNEALLARVSSGSISPTDQKHLDDLKYSDPDQWYAEKNRLEELARQTSRTQVQETLKQAEITAQEQYNQQELGRRNKILADFQSNTNLQLTEDVINNDVPPRIQQKLKDGMEYGAWLYEVAEYLKTPKTVENERIDNVTNIGRQGSASTTGSAVIHADYGSDTIY
jgi:hypothetical protein